MSIEMLQNLPYFWNKNNSLLQNLPKGVLSKRECMEKRVLDREEDHYKTRMTFDGFPIPKIIFL